MEKKRKEKVKEQEKKNDKEEFGLTGVEPRKIFKRGT